VADGLNAMLARVADFNAALEHEVRRATEELREANRQLAETAQRLFAARRDLARSEQLAAAGQTAATVAHQVGTPLNLISGYVQMIQADLAPESPSAVRLRTVQEQIKKVTTIVQDLLDRARRPLLHLSYASAAELVEGVRELARPSLQAAGITVRAEVDPELPVLHVDVGQMEQVLLNLITNSIDAMPAGGELRLAARLDGAGHVEIVVADSGTGIDPRHVARVFDPLFTTKERGRGTGLGLTIARDVVAAHGGSIAIANAAAGGTEVTVRLPAAAREQQKHA
jgi:signal transduction histidine kinase